MTHKYTYKAIISDFDGTLVDRDYAISDKVVDAIFKWVNTGNVFTIATGKALISPLIKIVKKLALKDPVIINGGAELINPGNFSVLYGEYLKEKEAKEIIKYLNFQKVNFNIVANSFVYLSSINLWDKKLGYDYIKGLTDLKLFNKISKIRLFCDGLKINKQKTVENYLKSRFKEIYIIQANTPSSRGFDITSYKATKYSAVLKFCQLISINLSQVIGVGDNYNDYSFLESCGYKVVTEDAPSSLIKIANQIIPRASEGGISFLIDSLLNK